MSKSMLRSVSIDDRLARFGFSIDTYSSVGTYPKGHYHQGIEILMVHLGDINVTMDGWSGEVRAGQVVVLHGHKHHVVRPLDRHFVRTALHFMPDLVVPGTPSHLIETIARSNGGKVMTLNGSAANRIFWAAGELRALSEDEQGMHDPARYLLALILSELAHADMQADHKASDLSIATVIYYMRHHLDRHETVEEVAARFFVSERQLYRLFDEQLHCSPKQYWLRLRMERAAELLQTTGSTIAEIAATVGFSSASGFERAFKRVMGLTSSEFRGQMNS